MSGDTEIRSPTSITTMGLTLIVHPAARLTIQAPTVSLARTEASALEREEVYRSLQWYGKIQIQTRAIGLMLRHE